MEVGDFVDIKGKNEKWHGIVAQILENQVTVMWLESDCLDDENKINERYSIPYFRGYTTIEKKSRLVSCDKGPQQRRHPTTNTWGKEYGVAN